MNEDEDPAIRDQELLDLIKQFNKKRGGFRLGAGRKPRGKENRKRKTIYIDAETEKQLLRAVEITNSGKIGDLLDLMAENGLFDFTE